MSITIDDARTASEFHIGHDGLPCTVWLRSGPTHYGPRDGQFFLPIFRNDDDDDRSPLQRNSETQYHHITGVNAGAFHISAECPRLRMSDDRPPASHMLTADAGIPTGRNMWGYDADGYDADGYDADGYDADGYDADGYDEDGNNADGFARGTDSSDLDLAGLWSGFRSAHTAFGRHAAFREYLRENITDPDSIGELDFCGKCGYPGWDDDMSSCDDAWYCDDCWNELPECASCDEKCPNGDLTETLSGSDICESCRVNYYSYCEYCDGYYNDNDSYDHDHEQGNGCCDSPQPGFSVRNDGCEPLAAGTRITFELPAGTIDAEGLEAIRQCLHSNGYSGLSYDVSDGKLGNQWQTRDGNFAKRLSRHAYKAYGIKLSQEIMSQVGCIARDHSNAVSVTVEVSRELNESAEYWYHVGSCWWLSYSESRCALKTNGGFGLRSFAGGTVSGRAWVLPLRKDEQGKLTPTFETMTPDAFVVFNGYGNLSGYAAPRIIAHMAGWTYRKISYDDGTMYVNAGGYLVAPEDIAAPYTDGSLRTHLSQHSCLYETERERELVSA